MPRVSVIIPTYNRANTLPAALESAFAQTFDDYEVIVVDDGSNDRTSDVVAQFGNRVNFVCQTNQGPAAARNRGLEIARGDLVAFLDSDDRWHPEKLAKQVALLDERPTAGWVYCDMDYFGSDAALKRKSSFRHIAPCEGVCLRDIFVRGCPMHTPTIMVRRECFARAGAYNTDLRVFEDHDLYYRLAYHFPVAYVNEVLVHCCRDASRPSAGPNLDGLSKRLAVKKAALQRFDDVLGSLTSQELRQAMLNEMMEAVYLNLERGDRSAARRLVWECISHQPLWIKAHVCLLGTLWPGGLLWLRNWLREGGKPRNASESVTAAIG